MIAMVIEASYEWGEQFFALIVPIFTLIIAVIVGWSLYEDAEMIGGLVAAVLIVSAVSNLIAFDMAKGRAKTLDAYADVREAGFLRPSELSVKGKRVLLKGPQCEQDFMLVRREGRYVVTLAKNGPELTPERLAQVQTATCR